MSRKDKSIDLSHIIRINNPFALAPRDNCQMERSFGEKNFSIIHVDNRIVTNRIEKMFDRCTFINCTFNF